MTCLLEGSAERLGVKDPGDYAGRVLDTILCVNHVADLHRVDEPGDPANGIQPDPKDKLYQMVFCSGELGPCDHFGWPKRKTFPGVGGAPDEQKYIFEYERGQTVMGDSSVCKCVVLPKRYKVDLRAEMNDGVEPLNIGRGIGHSNTVFDVSMVFETGPPLPVIATGKWYRIISVSGDGTSDFGSFVFHDGCIIQDVIQDPNTGEVFAGTCEVHATNSASGSLPSGSGDLVLKIGLFTVNAGFNGSICKVILQVILVWLYSDASFWPHQAMCETGPDNEPLGSDFPMLSWNAPIVNKLPPQGVATWSPNPSKFHRLQWDGEFTATLTPL